MQRCWLVHIALVLPMAATSAEISDSRLPETYLLRVSGRIPASNAGSNGEPAGGTALAPATHGDDAGEPSSGTAMPASCVEFYVGQVPPFAEAALASLYPHLCSSLAFFRVFKAVDGVSTYVTRRGGTISACLLFRQTATRVEVLNQHVAISASVVEAFAAQVFTRFADVLTIDLLHVETTLQRLRFPLQRHNSAEDYLLRLPPTAQDYTQQLGKATRRNIKRYGARLLEDHPSFVLRFYTAKTIRPEDVTQLLQMSEAKIVSQGKRFAVDPHYARGMIRLTRECGFVALATIDARLCAGLICFQTGSGFVAQVVAHDAAYDSYGLGTLCYYRTICEAIERGGTLFNLGIQRYDYKTRLLASRRGLDKIRIYRSRRAMFMRPHQVCGMWIGELLRNAKLHLQAHEKSRLTRFAIAALALARAVRARL